MILITRGRNRLKFLRIWRRRYLPRTVFFLFSCHNMSCIVMNRAKNRSRFCCNKPKLFEILILVYFCASESILDTQCANTYLYTTNPNCCVWKTDNSYRNSHFVSYKTNSITTIRQDNIFNFSNHFLS